MPPKSQEEEKDISSKSLVIGETSALLLQRPSCCSTDRPTSMTNLLEYGSLIPEEEESIQMHGGDASAELSFGEDEWPPKSHKENHKREIYWMLGFASLLSVLILGVFWYSNTAQHHYRIIHEQHGDHSRPFSQKHPVTDLNVKSFPRPEWSAPNPHLFHHQQQQPIPTNSWYQNLILARNDEPSQEQRVYPVPYVVDVVGPIPGIRVHPTTVAASATVIQMTQVLEHGLTLGAASPQSIVGGDDNVSKRYKIAQMTSLGITLEWTDPTLTYSSSIVRGMPYATMQYDSKPQQQSKQLLPTVASETPIGAPPILDTNQQLNCTRDEPQWVQTDIQLEFSESDYTWLVFVSRPVRVQCMVVEAKEPPEFVPGRPVPSPGIVFALQFLDDNVDDDSSDLVVRVALANDCTRGSNPITCGQTNNNDDAEAYANLLRQHADLYPGPDADVTFDFNNDSSTRMKFDWNVQRMSQGGPAANYSTQTEEDLGDDKDGERQLVDNNKEQEGNPELLMYTLPHHQDLIQESTDNHELSFPGGEESKFCKTSLLGPACLVEGSRWNLQEGGQQWETSFRAPRPPKSDALPDLVKAYQQDLHFRLPSYFQRGAGDTYFSGKMLAKLARILTIGEELHEICSDVGSRPDECEGLDIPSPTDSVFLDALSSLRGSVEVWINGTAETPFVYDDEWGGVVTCGCAFQGDGNTGFCQNKYPDCPAFFDPGLDFGNAFYNDHHFHLGYHIYAAAAVARFDPQWGREHFEEILLLVRDIANPSLEDSHFPTFRNKDWYQGSSWASGTAVSPLNGRNQESSSEAISAYEGVALFGKEMVAAWKGNDNENEEVAYAIRRYGEVMMASEVRSADRYWHVLEASKRRQFPVEYTPHVVGIMWTTMAQFQTWFGGEAYLAYGIQLLPLTPAAEKRDNAEWARQLYKPFAESCDAHHEDCRDGGWSVLVLAILATVGHHDEAIRRTLELPPEAFTSAGGNGHSLTNTLWYLATRPRVDSPLVIAPSNDNNHHDETASLEQEMQHQSDNPGNFDINGQPSNPEPRPPVVINPNFNCSCPVTCDGEALDHFAAGHSCRDRIVWLMTEKDHSEWEACHQVGLEFPGDCAACDPQECSASVEELHSESCPPCTKEVCGGELNRCSIQSAPFLCTQGASVGGCAQSPWAVEPAICDACCELSLGCED